MLLFLVTPRLVKPCMEWIPIKKNGTVWTIDAFLPSNTGWFEWKQRFRGLQSMPSSQRWYAQIIKFGRFFLPSLLSFNLISFQVIAKKIRKKKKTHSYLLSKWHTCMNIQSWTINWRTKHTYMRWYNSKIALNFKEINFSSSSIT